jgi:flagellar M-ring protein FliF
MVAGARYRCRHLGVGEQVNNLPQFLSRLGLARVAAMGVVALLLLGFFGFLMLRMTAPQMAPLYSGLTFEDSAAIISELQSRGLEYELRGEGETILVARDQITATRMALAESGLPTRGQVGYEIFDQQSTLGATSFVQNINNVRALEGELARTISSLARIRSARVHLVLPERELFQRERQAPSASIVLATRGELSNGEIGAIQHLVASAIEGLTTTRVSIVDDTGRLLASGGDPEDGALASQTEERQLAIENRLRGRLEQMLDNVLGAGRSRVQVTADLDLNRLTRTSETFDPDGQVARSTQVREEANRSEGAGDTGAVSVGNELPNAGGDSGSGGGVTQTGSTTEEVTNYEISKTTQTEIVEGGVRKLSVAVVIDGTYAVAADGAATYQPRSAAEITQITALVRTAVGFSEARGDQIEIVNMQFAERPGAGDLGSTGPGLFDFTRDDLINGAQMLVTLLIALALVLFIMRPLLRKVLAPEPALALPHSAEIASSHALAPATAVMDPVPLAEPQSANWMNAAKSMGEQQLQTLKTVGGLVGENPKQAAMIVRDWLNNAA